MSTCDPRLEAFVTLGGLPPRRLGVAGELPSRGEQRQVCEGCDLASSVEKISLVERGNQLKETRLVKRELKKTRILN